MNLSLTWLNKTMLLYMLFKSAYGKMWPSIIPVFSQLSRPCGFHQLLLQNVVFAVQSLFEQLHNLWSLRQRVLRSRFNISTDRTVNNVDFYNSFNAQCVGFTSRWFIFAKHKHSWRTGENKDHGNEDGVLGEGNWATKNRKYRSCDAINKCVFKNREL